jgi:F-type H+-transporting ATPase subunit gamma
MPSTRDIRRRIKSVKNTRQITKAMELVAASKMKRAQQAAIAGRPYAQLMAAMLARLSSRVAEAQHPFLVGREVKTRGILLVTTDKGLCGPLNANLFKLAHETSSQGTPVKFYAIGRKGAQFLARTKRDLVADFAVTDRVGFAEVKPAIELMCQHLMDGTIDTIEIIYSRFKNTLVQEPIVRPVLPLSGLTEFLAQAQAEAGNAGATVDTRDMIFEPSAQQVLEALVPFYVNRLTHQIVLSAKASEHSARMVAMKTAKDNATKLLGDLTLEYNKARQSAITAEILEIAAAQFASV